MVVPKKNNCCLFCNNPFNFNSPSEKSLSCKVLKKFFKILESHLNTKFESLKTFNMKTFNLNNFNQCEKCLKSVDSICSYYEELKSIELKLQWKLDTLLEITTSEFKTQTKHRSDSKVKPNLGLVNLRNEFVKKCSKKRTQMQPKILLAQLQRLRQIHPIAASTSIYFPPAEASTSSCVKIETPAAASRVYESDYQDYDDDSNSNFAANDDFTDDVDVDPDFEPPPDFEAEYKPVVFGTSGETEIVSKVTAETPSEMEVDTEIITTIPDFDSEEPLVCHVVGCTERFTLVEELQNHSAMHGEFTCSKCSEVLYYAPDLALHELEHENQNKKKISKSVDEPGKVKGNEKLKCPRCDDLDDLRGPAKMHLNRYIKHFLESHLELPWANLICSICRKPSYVFVKVTPSHRKRIRLEHFQVNHDLIRAKLLDTTGAVSGDPQKCDQCPAFFSTRKLLHMHRFKIHQKNQLQCTERNCGKFYCNQRSLRRHLETIHKITFKFPCNFEGCSRRFRDESDLVLHQTILHRQKQSEAEKSRKSKLVKKKMFTCGICSEVLFGQEEFKCHQVATGHQDPNKNGQSGENDRKKFVCEQCGAAFANKYKLWRHGLTHQGPEAWQFSCDICGKKCPTEQQLRRHGLSHTGEKPYQCTLCGSRYAEKRDFRNHVLRKHGQDEADALVPKFYEVTASGKRKIKNNEDTLINASHQNQYVAPSRSIQLASEMDGATAPATEWATNNTPNN